MRTGWIRVVVVVFGVVCASVLPAQEAAEVVEIGADPPEATGGEAATGEGFVPVPPAMPFSSGGMRTESSSRQFHVFGDTLRLRGAFAVFAEDVKREYLRLLKAKDDWRYPIVITVVADRLGSGGKAVRSVTEEVAGAGFRFRIRAELTDEFSRELLREELVRMLIAEHVLRGYESAPASSGVLVPWWLHAGVLEAMSYRREGRASGVFASIMDRGILMDIGDLYRGNPERMDSVTEALWRASSGALVLTLLEQPSGADRFEAMLGRMAEGAGDMDYLLRKSFPGFRASRFGIEKWWALQVATMARPTVFEVLGQAETEALLAEALTIYYPEEELEEGGAEGEAQAAGDGESVTLPVEMSAATGWQRCEITEFEKVIGRKDVGLLVKRNRLLLLSLELRAFQLARPIVAEYRELVGQIAEGKTKGLGEKLRLLEARRADLMADAKAVEDYLNWFEATQTKRRSGAFDGYLEAVKKIESSRIKRMNPISRALDEVEEQLK